MGGYKENHIKRVTELLKPAKSDLTLGVITSKSGSKSSIDWSLYQLFSEIPVYPVIFLSLVQRRNKDSWEVYFML